jgi:vacuolar-type H+-ATPase subunit E/Vma4
VADLTALLEREASAEIDAILSEARERAAEIVALAEREAEARAAARERSVSSERDAMLVRSRSAAQLDAAAVTLRARHAVVEAVFAEARERLVALSQEPKAYEPVLTALLQEAVDALGTDAIERVEVAAGDVALARRITKAAGIRAAVEAGDVEGGVRVRSRRGSSIENTLSARLEATRDESSSLVAQILFADGDPEA